MPNFDLPEHSLPPTSPLTPPQKPAPKRPSPARVKAQPPFVDVISIHEWTPSDLLERRMARLWGS